MLSQLKRSIFDVINWTPLSARGVLVLSGFIWTLIYFGWGKQDRLFLAVSVGGLLVLSALALTVLITATCLRRTKLTATGEIRGVGHQPYITGLVIPWIQAIPCVMLNVRWLHCDSVQVQLVRTPAGLSEMIRASRRLHRDGLTRSFEVGDVFGLCSIRFKKASDQSVHIEPMPASDCIAHTINRDQHGDESTSPNGSPNGDLIEMRHYRPGDPLKLVLWKHFVRTGQLLVRQPENSVASKSQMVACFVAGPGDEASAGVARSIIGQMAQRGEEIVFQADGAASPTDSATAAINQIISSADIGNRGGQVIQRLAASLKHEAAQRCIAFVPSRPGPWLDQVIESQRRLPISIDAIVGVDEFASRRRLRWFPSWAFADTQNHETHEPHLRSVVDQLFEAGIQTQVLRRSNGEMISVAALEATAN